MYMEKSEIANKKEEALKELLELSTPLRDILSTIDKLDEVNSDKTLITIENRHITNVLSCFLAGKVSEHDVEDWSNAIEANSSLIYSEPSEMVLRSAIHCLANPRLTQKLTAEFARELLETLK